MLRVRCAITAVYCFSRHQCVTKSQLRSGTGQQSNVGTLNELLLSSLVTGRIETCWRPTWGRPRSRRSCRRTQRLTWWWCDGAGLHSGRSDKQLSVPDLTRTLFHTLTPGCFSAELQIWRFLGCLRALLLTQGCFWDVRSNILLKSKPSSHVRFNGTRKVGARLMPGRVRPRGIPTGGTMAD